LQLISLSSDSLNSTVKACEECKEKLVSSGDHNESIDQKLDAILKQLNSLSLELENIKNDCSPLNLFEAFIVIYD
jgi:flagellin-like hook-associated protein FlgL